VAVKDVIKASANKKENAKAKYYIQKKALKEYITQYPDQKEKIIEDAKTITNEISPEDKKISAKKQLFINMITNLVNRATTRGGSRRKLHRTLKKRK